MAEQPISSSRPQRIREALRSPLLQVASTRIVTFPITVGCGLVWLRVVIGNVDTADYALIAIVVGFQFLLSFLDFGMTAHLLDEAGKYAASKSSANLATALGRSFRAIVFGNAIVFLCGLGVALAGVWGSLAGFPERSSTVAFAVLLTLGINIVARPLSLANSLVAGLGRPTVAQWSQVAGTVVSLGCVILVVLFELPIPWVVATPIFGQAVASIIPLVVSMKIVPGLFRATVKAFGKLGGQTTRMGHLAAPMLLIQIIEPLNDQLDRVILGHLSTVEAVATYSLGAQFFASAATVISALFPTLWVQFAELRVLGGDGLVASRAFLYIKRTWAPAVVVGAAFAVGVWLVGPLVSAGKIEMSWPLCAALGATFPFFVIRSIIGLALTDRRGLRIQAIVTTLTTTVNLALTFSLAEPYGAFGPVLASLIAVFIDGVLLAIFLRRSATAALSQNANTDVDTGQ